MTGRCHHAHFAQCWDGTQGFANGRQTFYHCVLIPAQDEDLNSPNLKTSGTLYSGNALRSFEHTAGAQ